MTIKYNLYIKNNCQDADFKEISINGKPKIIKKLMDVIEEHLDPTTYNNSNEKDISQLYFKIEKLSNQIKNLTIQVNQQR